MTDIQPAQELEQFYAQEDPWRYDENPDDRRRLDEIRGLLGGRRFRRALDIGCGNGFVTTTLPAEKIVGIDLSQAAIAWARKRADALPDADRFEFEALSVFDIGKLEEKSFDLVVITGVLYPQYIGKSFSLIRLYIDRLLQDGGVLLSCHIDEWMRFRFPYTLIDQSIYPYREYTHRIEVFIK